MPRLGDDPNMATAYPDRVNTNLRGSWMRQMLYTLIGTLVLYKVVFTDYKSATKENMARKGLSEEAQERIVPKTSSEKRREAQMAKLSQAQKSVVFQHELGNLTNAVIELQKLVAEHHGVTVEHPISLGEKEEGDGDADEGDEAPDSAGRNEGGDPPTVNLRGAGADEGNPDRGGDEGGDGGHDGTKDAGGERARRLFTRMEGGDEEKVRRATARDEPAALRGGIAGPRQLKGSPREGYK